MAAEFFEKVATITAYSDRVFSVSILLRLNLTLLSSLPSSSAAPDLCPSSPLFLHLRDLSLLFEACGRTVNPVNGAVGLMWTGNWHICQTAVQTVLRGGLLREMSETISGSPPDDASEVNELGLFRSSQDLSFQRSKSTDTKELDRLARLQPNNLDLGLTSSLPPRIMAGGNVDRKTEKRRAMTPLMNSEESDTTTLESDSVYHQSSQTQGETKLLRLFF